MKLAITTTLAGIFAATATIAFPDRTTPPELATRKIACSTMRPAVPCHSEPRTESRIVRTLGMGPTYDPDCVRPGETVERTRHVLFDAYFTTS